MSHLNNNSLNIKLAYKHGRRNMDLLDVQFHVDDNGFVISDLFRKSTATNSVLHVSSGHPSHLIRNIPVGQHLRIWKICSTEMFFEQRANELKQRFSERGYPTSTLTKAYKRVKASNRTDLMHRKKIKSSDQQVRFITPYNAQSQLMRKALQKHWGVLLMDDTLSQYLPKSPSITHRRADNLKDTLVKSHHIGTPPGLNLQSNKPKWGCKKCGSCVACPNIMQTNKFWNSTKTKEFTITHNISCNTTHGVYFAICPCQLIYVGLTTRELKRRVREHVLSIRSAREGDDILKLKTIPRHFKIHHECNPQGLKVWGIDRILINQRGGNFAKLLAQREAKWIHVLDIVVPHGLNENLSFAPFL